MLQSAAIAPVDQFKSFKVLESMNFFYFYAFFESHNLYTPLLVALQFILFFKNKFKTLYNL